MKTRLLATLAVVLIPLAANAVEPALGGNCPVCLVEMGKFVPGSNKHTVSFDRQVYYFPSDEQKRMFAANPAKYAPALGGDCVVCRVNMGVRMPGKAEFAVIHDKRAFLFPSTKERDVFKADPKKYEAADVGMGFHKPRAPMTTDGDGSSRAVACAGVCPHVSLNRRESEGFGTLSIRTSMGAVHKGPSNLQNPSLRLFSRWPSLKSAEVRGVPYWVSRLSA